MIEPNKEKRRILGVVSDRLKRRPYAEEADLVRDVVEKGVREDGGFWYVPVAMRGEAKNTFNYYGYLAKLEMELEDDGFDIVLVPCLESEISSGAEG